MGISIVLLFLILLLLKVRERSDRKMGSDPLVASSAGHLSTPKEGELLKISPKGNMPL